jgi:Ca-activated chloride channel family protein
MWGTFSLIVVFAIASSAFAQQVQESVKVELVNVYLSATDSKGQFVTDLKPNDLLLKEDGVPQSITHFANFAEDGTGKLGEKDVPLTVAFVIDTSTSMGAVLPNGEQKINIVKNAAFRLLQELRQEDKMMLIGFDENPDLISPLMQEKKLVSGDLLFMDVTGGNTALLDSIYFALENIKEESGRKVIVVCSDGEDTASLLRFNEVLSNLIASDVTVLAFGTMSLNSSSLRGRYILEKMASASGGYAFFPTSLSQLDKVMEKLRQGMRSQYSLGYVPLKHDSDGTWRKIDIQTKRAGLKLRFREGYYAN